MIKPSKRHWLGFSIHVLLVGLTLYLTAGNAGIRFILGWTASIALAMVGMHHFVSAMGHLFILAIARHPKFPQNPETDQAIKGFDYGVVHGFLWALFYFALGILSAGLIFA